VTVEITYAWCVLFLLRRHLRRAVLARNATRPELLTLKIVFGKRRFNAIRPPMVISVLDHAHAPGFYGLRVFVVFLPGWLADFATGHPSAIDGRGTITERMSSKVFGKFGKSSQG
jgi:hypothetical protein